MTAEKDKVRRFRFVMERPHQYGFGTWADAIRNAREIEAVYGLDVAIHELSPGDARRCEYDEGAYFADLTTLQARQPGSAAS